MAKRKKVYDDAERRAIIAEYRASGLTQSEFSKQQGVSLWTLRSWLYKKFQTKGKARPKRKPRKARLVEVRLAGARSNVERQGFKVSLRSGHGVEVPCGFEREELRSLVEILEGTC